MKLGIIPGYGGTQRLPRLVGKGRALQMILTGEMINAQEAYRIGLVNEVVPAPELIGRAEAVLKQMAGNAPLSVKYALQAVNKGLETSLSEGLLHRIVAGRDLHFDRGQERRHVRFSREASGQLQGTVRSQMNTDHIFKGLKVVDLASFLAGPGAATVLSDFGADVVKIEPPGIGDPHRMTYRIPPLPSAKENYSWHLSNRNKRGLALDLKSPRSREILERLVKWADVLVVNFPPPVRKKLKLTYEDIAPWNPRLIYADLTGYGDEGPDTDLPGFDITAYWSRSGLLDMTRDAGAPPTLPVPASGDHASGDGPLFRNRHRLVPA